MRSTILAASVLCLVGLHAIDPAQAEVANGAQFGDWTVACTAETTQRTVCALTQVVVAADTGAFLAEIGLNPIRDPEGVASVLVVLRTPSATLLPISPALRVGEEDAIEMTWRTCAGDFCTALSQLDPATIESMRRGRDMLLGYQRVADAQPVTFRVSLAGVTAGLNALTEALVPVAPATSAETPNE